jgi:hypothetical protein
MRLCVPICAALVLAAGAGAGRAQQQGEPGCVAETLPFAANTANQLKGEALSGPLGSKTLVALRTRTGRGARKLRFKFTLRPDGSAVILCEGRPDEAGAWQPCRQFNPESTRAPGRDLGIWRIEADQLVFQRIRFSAAGRDEGRFTFHQANGVVEIRRLSGPGFCLPGAVTFE